MGAQRASLLGLPVELWLTVFELVLLNSRIKLSPIKSSQQATAPSSLAICQQIRSEIFELFYETCTFEFRDGFTEELLTAWMDRVGREAVEKMKKVIFWGRGKCGMFGLQPDTDYCHRRCTFNPGNLTATLRPVDLNEEYCSNRAIGCSEPTEEALFRVVARTYTAGKRERMLGIWRVLREDRCESAA